MITYTKSLSSDFGGNINLENLHNEISIDSLITTVLIGINLTEDIVEIVFDESLSSEEILELDNVISTHNSVQRADPSEIKVIYPKIDYLTTSSYKLVSRFVYDGSIYKGIDSIKILSYKDPSITSYDIKIYNDTNEQTIGTINLTNNTEQINDITTLTNIPTGFAIIEIWGKKNGGSTDKRIYINNIIFYLSKL